MERLGPGETVRAAPRATPPRTERDRDPDPPPRRSGQYHRQPVEPEQRIEIAPDTRFGTLSLRIQPGDAEVLIDGERWTTTPGDSRITIRLSPGRHKIEIRKDGFERYSEEIGVRENTDVHAERQPQESTVDHGIRWALRIWRINASNRLHMLRNPRLPYRR